MKMLKGNNLIPLLEDQALLEPGVPVLLLPPGVDNKPRPGVLVPRLGVLAPLKKKYEEKTDQLLT